MGTINKSAIWAAFCVALLVGCSPKVDPPKAHGPLPSEKQIAWHEMEFYAFVHFSLNTFTNKEWGFGDESPEIFNPTELDTRQWARVAKEAGMKGIILTAKHHDGFCLWPSEFTDHSVEKAPWKNGKGDVVRELAEACREYDLKLGLYLSPWDRNHPEYGRETYVTYFRNQLKELLTEYGDVFEMWFDGANGGNGYYGGANETRKINTLEYYDWQTTYDSIYKWSPNTLVWGVGPSEARWIGNEEGFANKTNWSLLRQKDELAGKVHYTEFMSGHEDGERWVPGEADVSIRPGWFYHAVEDDKVRSLSEMVDIYYHSIGRNANLLLNLPVDRRGLVHENDEARLKELMAVIKADFAKELLAQASVEADQVRGGADSYAPENLIDGDKNTYWATDDSITKASLTFRFKSAQEVNRVLLQEYIRLGQRVQAFTVEAEVNGAWETIAEETTIGYKRILRTKRVKATALRIQIKAAKASPVLHTIQAFNAPTLVAAPEISRDKAGLVTITPHQANEVVFYTTDGSEPSEKSQRYTRPFSMVDAGIIKAISRIEAEGMNSNSHTIQFGVSKNDWSVKKVVNGKNDDALTVIDGDFQSSFKIGLPGAIEVDMGKVHTISGFTYMPKQVGNGLRLVSNYELYTSVNGTDWVLRSSGEFSNIKHNPILQRKEFEAKVMARYLKFVPKTEVEGMGEVSIAELGILP